MNRNDILSLLQAAKTKEQYKQLREQLRPMDEAELFSALYSIAVEPPHQKPPFPILFAGKLLFELNPKCQKSCIEAIRPLLNGWDVSLEEVPFYVYRQFGMSAVQEAIEQLRAEALTDEQHKYLQTVEYWAKIADEGIERFIAHWSML